MYLYTIISMYLIAIHLYTHIPIAYIPLYLHNYLAIHLHTYTPVIYAYISMYLYTYIHTVYAYLLMYLYTNISMYLMHLYTYIQYNYNVFLYATKLFKFFFYLNLSPSCRARLQAFANKPGEGCWYLISDSTQLGSCKTAHHYHNHHTLGPLWDGI